MTLGLAQARAAASRVAKGLLGKGRPDEAVAVLAAWAATGSNDPEGQNLLAEALRIDPASPLAKLAFERMEGIAGDHAALETAIARWSLDELARAEQDLARPAFLQGAGRLQQQRQVQEPDLSHPDGRQRSRQAARHHAPLRRRRARHQEPQAVIRGARVPR